MKIILAIFALVVALAAPARAAAPQPLGWKAILIAGDDEEVAFDDAVDAMAGKLEAFGVPASDITVLKSSGTGVHRATVANIDAAFDHLHLGPHDGCFVYATSHGAPGRGLVIRAARAYLSPRVLNVLLNRACGTRPTVVIASGCYSGIFAEGPPLIAPNRIILTAARDDRPSFGCNADLEYTVFDGCILKSLKRGLAWPVVMDRARACVSGNEWDMRVMRPSDPQLSVGRSIADLRVFAR